MRGWLRYEIRGKNKGGASGPDERGHDHQHDREQQSLPAMPPPARETELASPFKKMLQWSGGPKLR